MATIGQALTTPESGWKRMNADHPLLSYKGSWTTQTNSAYSGGINKYTSTPGDTISFTFKGTKLRYIGQYNTTSKTPISISIDGVTEQINFLSNTLINSVLVYEKIGLAEGNHTVVLTFNATNEYQSIQGIDIDSSGRLLHPDEVTDIKDLAIGKRIRCSYSATSNAVGIFSGLGKETAEFIPVSGTTSPNGDFYFIMVEDINKKKILIADRNIQNSLTWDVLNNAGFASGSGLPWIIPNSPSSVRFSIRLLTGGVSTTDKDNEWDKYIVNSTLNGTTTPGNNNVWNWRVTYTLTSSTITGSPNARVIRGRSDVNFSSSYNTNTLYDVNGFRPLLEIKSSPQIKSLILSNGEYKTLKNSYTVTERTATPISIVMTSNSTPLPYVVSASSADPNYPAYLAFDGVNATVTDCWVCPSYTGWLKIDLGTQIAVGNYEIEKGYRFVDDAPKEWTFEGSNNDADWTILDTQTNQINWTKGEKRSYMIANPMSFRYYRVNVVTSENSAYLTIGALNLLEYGTVTKTVNALFWETVSTTLPDADTFISEGMDDLSIFNRKLTTVTIPMNDNTASGVSLGKGKMFKERIDLNKYIDIKKINVK